MPTRRPASASRATLYVRLSNASTEANLSKIGMISDLRALADRLGCEIMGEHVDDGISGSVRDRPEFLAWLRDAREGRADVMLAWSGDRLTREGINAAALVLDAVEGKDERTGKVVRAPVRFVSFDDRLDSSEGDAFRWRFVIAAEVARGERARMVSRNTARARRMLDQGRHVGAIPFGYRLDPERRAVLVVDDTEAAAIREAARRVLSDGNAPGQVARWLNAAGPRPRTAREWTRTVVVQILTNPANAGEPLRAGATGREAILSFAEVAELRRRLIATTATSGVKRSRGSLAMLSGILRCHDCERPMRSSSGRYQCMTAAEGASCGGAVSVMRKIAEAAAEADFLARWGRLVETRRVVALTGAAERDSLEREHAAILARLAHAPAADDFAALQANAARRAELDAVPAQRESIEVATGRTFADAWARATPEDRRDTLSRFYDMIVCYPHNARPDRLDFIERADLACLSVDEHGEIT